MLSHGLGNKFHRTRAHVVKKIFEGVPHVLFGPRVNLAEFLDEEGKGIFVDQDRLLAMLVDESEDCSFSGLIVVLLKVLDTHPIERNPVLALVQV